MGIRIRKGNASGGGFVLKDNRRITKREIEALCLVANGMDNKTGADLMHVTINTFRNHIQHIIQKLNAKNRANAIVKAIENDMVEIDRNRNIVMLYPSDYILCGICGRVFEENNMAFKEGGKITINNVEYEEPEEPICPYEDCKGSFTTFLRWDDVKNKCPEYPKIPEVGKVYDYETSLFFD